MNSSGLECSSGCESGWTGYFDQGSTTIEECSWCNCEKAKLGFSKDEEEEEEEEEEDLSMVSDASSGPPPLHFQEYYYGSAVAHHQPKYMSNHKSNTRNDDGKNMISNKQQHNLEDTATSPFFHLSRKNVGNDNDDTVGKTYGFPPHFEDDSISKKQKGFFKSSKKAKLGSLIGRKRQ